MGRQKWSTHTMEYYLAMTRNEVLIHDAKCANLENIMLNGKKKKPVPKDHMLHNSIYMRCPEQAKPQKQKAG